MAGYCAAGWVIGIYTNRRDARILLIFKDGKKLVLSAEQSLELTTDIEQRLAIDSG